MSDLYIRNGDKLECILCPHRCILGAGKAGICGVRQNTGEKIELLTYGIISGYALDPIEKKPLYHFYPGTNILSVGSYGCNMKCDFCQNYSISQRRTSGYDLLTEPAKIINDAETSLNNIGIAFTYNEPVIWFEFIRDVAVKARKKGFRIVLVSNGFINPGPLEEIISFTDAFNIDLKAFGNDFYRKLTGAELYPVLETLKSIARAGRHLEITTLVIPGLNDSADEMKAEAEWIASELGREVPLHLSRYFPMYRREDPATPPETLLRLAETASKSLSYVYTGNINLPEFQNTLCPKCGKKLVKRSGYSIKISNLDKKGRCRECGTQIFTHFTSFSSSIQN